VCAFVVFPLIPLLLGVSAPAPATQKKNHKARELIVLGAAAREASEPAFPLICVGAEGKLKEGAACRAPLPGTKARRPKESEHTIGRSTSAAPCELSKQRRLAVAMDPAVPRGPFLAVWPSADSGALVPADELATRVPDAAMLEALGGAVGGTAIIDQSLSVDVDGDEKADRLIAVHSQAGVAQLVLFSGATGASRPLPIPGKARALHLLATSDLDRDHHLELYLFAQLEAGWELWVIADDRENALASLVCAAR
jgi:hypothetical protein